MSAQQLKDVDTAAGAQKLHAAVLSLMGSVIFGLLGLFMYGLPGLVLGWAIGFAVIYFAAMGLAERMGSAGSSVYMASGTSTPAHREYSLGDALVAQAKFAEAVAEFERNAAAYADDPEPRLRLARVYRDRMGQPEQAAHWFKQTLAILTLNSGTEALAGRELVELYTRKLHQPERALPILARLAEHQPTTAAGIWARAELDELKQQIRDTP